MDVFQGMESGENGGLNEEKTVHFFRENEEEMSKFDKVLQRVLRGTSDTNIPFTDLCYLLEKFGFDERIKGDHHIFTRDDVREIINLQPKGNLAKIYQVKQVRGMIVKYKLEA